MSRGYFITFEGLDGSGKTTQLKQLASWLEERGHQVITTREPGGTLLGQQIRTLLVDSRSADTYGNIAPRAEMALMFADRAQDIAEVIEPSLQAGKIVLCDRWTDSSEAYQGAGRQLGAETILAMHHAVCGDFWPDMTVLLQPDLKNSLYRARRRNDRQQAVAGKNEGRFEAESDAFFARIHTQYALIAQRESKRVALFSSNASIAEIQTQIRASVEDRLRL